MPQNATTWKLGKKVGTKGAYQNMYKVFNLDQFVNFFSY